MRTIHKFQSVVAPEVAISMPTLAHIVLVELQHHNGEFCIWAEVDTEHPLEVRNFSVIGTGQAIPPNHVHVGSWQAPPFVWHLFEHTGGDNA
jgi:hypothetical protein